MKTWPRLYCSDNALLSLGLNLHLGSRGQAASPRSAPGLFAVSHLPFSILQAIVTRVQYGLCWNLQFFSFSICHLYRTPQTGIWKLNVHLLHPQRKAASHFVSEGCFTAEFIPSSSVTRFNAQTLTKLKPNITTGNLV